MHYLLKARRVCAARAAATSLALVLALAGCGDESDPGAASGPKIVQPGAPGDRSRTLSQEELEELEPPSFVKADVEFMQGMIHHHAQALQMTALVPERSVGNEIPLLAERMEISQQSEIEQMQRWLRDRRQSVPAVDRMESHGHGDTLMPGMLNEAELRRLDRADGRVFERLFLRYMIRHHEGALTMVRRLYAAGGGVEPEADAFARHVDADQRIEIGRMQQLLAARS